MKIFSRLASSKLISAVGVQQLQNASISTRMASNSVVTEPDGTQWTRRIFSGIQPTGAIHLGNYLGAVRKWAQLQNARENVTFCIVDMHSITVPQTPITLRENIFLMAASLLACGIDPDQSTFFVQSAVKEHAELCWILNCMTTMARLGHLPQYKEKTRLLKDIPLGLFVYPVLQAADIMLYKATHVPVGEDQIQHIQLAQHLTRTFNTKYGSTFPICHAITENKELARIRSLRDPNKKMSKSDSDPKSVINIMDEPEVIMEKVKKAVTDFCSDVHYSPETRQGVSNLIVIHSLMSGQSIKSIIDEAKSIDTGKYKMRVADAIIEHLKPIRTKIHQQLARRNELIYILETGAERAREEAAQTMSEVRQKLGLGASGVMPIATEIMREEPNAANISKLSKSVGEKKASGEFGAPEVPKQQLRVEKKRQARVQIKADLKFDIPKAVFKSSEAAKNVKSTLPVPVQLPSSMSKPITNASKAEPNDKAAEKVQNQAKL